MNSAFEELETSQAGMVRCETSIDLPVERNSVWSGRSLIVEFYVGSEKAFGTLAYEIDGHHTTLAAFDISQKLAAEITGVCFATTARDVLAILREVQGNVTISDGVAWLPDGKSLDLNSKEEE